MCPRVKKQTVLVIFEGITDQDALGQIFDEYFSTQNVRVALTHGDITARDSINPSNIRATVGDIVRGFLKRSKLKAEDLAQIIQVADTDGAYIPDSSIIESTNLQRFRYTLSTIEGADKSQIVKRNERKQSNLNELHTMGVIHLKKIDVPYRIYYMSCNLDHVLYDLQNATKEEKSSYAYNFAEQYENNTDNFCKFIRNSSFSVCEDYQSSWDFIKQGNNSLCRYSNLGICFKN